MNASGTKTSTVVKVEPKTAPVISLEAASTGSAAPSPLPLSPEERGVLVSPPLSPEERGVLVLPPLSPEGRGVLCPPPSPLGGEGLGVRGVLPPGVKWREMFSTTTTVSSMMRPMATARPPSDIRLSVSPLQ